MRFPNDDMIDIRDDTSNMYYITISDNQKDNMTTIEKKLESIHLKNTNLLDEIMIRENSSVIIGHDYTLECNLPSWEIRTVPKVQDVGIILNQWRYSGKALEQPKEDLCNDKIKYSISKFSDLERLNNELTITSMKYLKFLRDTQETRQILQIFLNNLYKVHDAIQEVDTITKDQKDIKDDTEIGDAMVDILKGFSVLNTKLPNTTLTMNSSGFVGVSSELKPESIFELNEEHSLKDIDKKIELAGRINEKKLDEILSRGDEVTPVGFKYSVKCDLPNNKYKDILPENKLCMIKTATKAQKVNRTLQKWKYGGPALTKTDVMSKDGIDYTLEQFNDLSRLNKDIVQVGRKSASCLADIDESREILQILLSNLELIHDATLELETLSSSDLRTIQENSKVMDGIQNIVDGFNALEENTGSVKLSFEADGYIGNFTESTVCCDIDINKLANTHSMHPHTSNVNSLQCYTENGLKYLVSGSYDKTVKIFDLEKNKNDSILDISTASAQIYALAVFEIHGMTVMACGGYGSHGIDVWNLSGSKVEYTLEGHSCNIHALQYYERNDHPYLISGSGDKTIKVWDLLNKTCVETLTGHFSNISSLVLYKDNEGKSMLTSGSGDGLIKIWDLQSMTLKTTVEGHTSHIFTIVTFVKEGVPYLASGSQDTSIKIWNLNTFTLEATLVGDSSWVWTLTVCDIQDSPYLASGGFDGMIRLWDMTSYTIAKTLVVPSGNPIRSLTTYHENDSETWYLVSGHNDGSIFLWTSE